MNEWMLKRDIRNKNLKTSEYEKRVLTNKHDEWDGCSKKFWDEEFSLRWELSVLLCVPHFGIISTSNQVDENGHESGQRHRSLGDHEKAQENQLLEEVLRTYQVLKQTAVRQIFLVSRADAREHRVMVQVAHDSHQEDQHARPHQVHFRRRQSVGLRLCVQEICYHRYVHRRQCNPV